MSVIPEQSTTPVPPTSTPEPVTAPVDAPVPAPVPVPVPPVPAPQVDPPTPPAGDELPSLDDYNKSVQEQLGGEEAPADEAKPVEEAKPEGEAETVEAGGDDAPIEYKLGADVPFEEFAEQRDAYLANVEITPELQDILDRQNAEIAARADAMAELGGVANRETIVKFGSAVNRLYDAQVDPKTGEEIPNTAPIVEFMRTELTREFRPIAEAILSSDSTKYKGVSILEEVLVDTFGAEKATKMVEYGQADTPLPVVAPQLQLPAAIDERSKEAFFRMPEVKRFEIQTLVDDINALNEDLKDASPYRKEELARDLQEKKEKLDAEVYAVNSIQRSIDQDRETIERTNRQQAVAAIEFRNEVNTAYNQEVFGIAETFAKDLAPRLTYADGDTQLSQARNILARVNGALAFIIENDGSFKPDPIADMYAGQLTEEGVKYDFAKGRELLQRHYKACERLTGLERQKASPQSINVARTAKNAIESDIKAEQKQLMGMLSTKYVASNASAVTKQTKLVQGKKQAAVKVLRGNPVTKTAQKPVEAELAEYNRKVAATTGEELFESYQS
jgi:uncharacterized protein YoxC